MALLWAAFKHHVQETHLEPPNEPGGALTRVMAIARLTVGRVDYPKRTEFLWIFKLCVQFYSYPVFGWSAKPQEP